MSGTRAAIRYAKAILSVAEDNNTSAKIHEEMNQIASAIASNPELNEVLKSPVVKLSEKTAVLEKIFATSGAEVKSLFSILAQNKRVDLLEQIAQQYKRLFDEFNNKEQATVTTAVPMTEALEKKGHGKVKNAIKQRRNLDQNCR